MAANDAAVPGRDHVVVFPFMAKGHMLPLLHFAAALTARHGVDDAGICVTVVTTPANVAFARRRLPSSVRVVALPFPAHPDLPPGAESTDALPSQSLFPAFLRATAALRAPFAAFLASLPSPPLALVSDFFLGFTQRVAAEAGVRRITFHGEVSTELEGDHQQEPHVSDLLPEGPSDLTFTEPGDVLLSPGELPWECQPPEGWSTHWED